MSKWPGNSQRVATSFGGLSRSTLMSRIRSAGNATTELRLMKLFRVARIVGWRRNYPLPGKPDFVFPSSRLAVFVDGCFWHGHLCGRNLTPRRNGEAWVEKIDGNRRRDRRISRLLREKGWQVVRVWECSLRRNAKVALSRIRRKLDRERLRLSARMRRTSLSPPFTR